MRVELDLKSLLVGAIVTTLLFFAIGAGNSALRVGRCHLEIDDNHAFVIDSVTGEVWEQFLSQTGGSRSPDLAKPKT
jgi:hypothetical protein